MIFENLKKNFKNNNNLYSFNKNEIIEDINVHNNTSNFIYNNNQILINDDLNDFIKEKNYKAIKNKNIKDDIFYFASFINSCKTKKNILSIKKELCTIFKSNIENEDYYYNIIYNYFNNILELILVKEFFYNIKNIDYLSQILEGIEIYMKVNNDNFFEIKNEILIVENKIMEILTNNIYYTFVPKCINILKNIIESIENSIEFERRKILNENKIKNLINSMKNNYNSINLKNKISNNNKEIKEKEDIIIIEKSIDNEKSKKLNENKIKSMTNSMKNYYNAINLKNKMLNNNELKEKEIIIHFDTYKKNKKMTILDNLDNDYKNKICKKENFSQLNYTFIEDNSISNADYCSKNNINLKNTNFNDNINFEPINENKKKKKKKKIKDNSTEQVRQNEIEENNENQIFYNYENIMCPPIKSDSD